MEFKTKKRNGAGSERRNASAEIQKTKMLNLNEGMQPCVYRGKACFKVRLPSRYVSFKVEIDMFNYSVRHSSSGAWT